MSLLDWLRALARRLRIGASRQLRLASGQGAVIVAGQNAGLTQTTPNRRLTAEAGAFVRTGVAAALDYVSSQPGGGTLTANVGAFTYTGRAASLVRVVPSSRLGIPAVPTGLEIDTPAPSMPGTWTANVANYYYVKQGGTNSGNGYPASPRGSIPNPIPAGGIVVVDNTATLTITGAWNLQMSGTSGQRCWLIGSGQVGLGSGTAYATLQFSSGSNVAPTYSYIDGIDFYTPGTSASYTGFGRPIETLFRNCDFRGDGAARTTNSSSSISGQSDLDRATNVVFYNLDFRLHGNWQYHVDGTDVDVHALQLGKWINGMWILDCNFHHCQGDGIQGTAVSNSQTDIINIYVNGCQFYQTLQSGFWIKMGSNIVFSENDVWDYNLASGGAPVGIGLQYDLGADKGIWILKNRVWSCAAGAIRAAGASSAVITRKFRVIGNIIYGLRSPAPNLNSANSTGTAISFWQGNDIVVAFNTIYDYDGQGISATNNSGMNIKIENNIVQGRTNAAGFDILLESIGSSTIRNNQFPASPHFRVGGADYSSVTTLQSNNPTNRSNNRSGATSFVDAVSADFRLQAGDGAINAGLLTTDVFAEFQNAFGLDIRKDFLGVTRPQGAQYDIGAYEQ